MSTIDRKEYEDIFCKLAEPVNEYLRRKNSEQQGEPDASANFTALTAIASVVGMIVGMIMASAPEAAHERIRQWFDDTIDEAIADAVKHFHEAERVN